MSHAYQAVQWNHHKKVYDGILLLCVLLYNAAFIGITMATHAGPNDLAPEPILLIRSTATCAFGMLHIILCIGPLARLSPRFAPLLYNRRHFGVMMFSVALVHAIIALIFYHGLGDTNPLVSLFTENTRYDSLAHFPFQVLGFGALLILFVMAATSHDYWLKNLGPGVWKALHMGVYIAYALLVMHVALGALQSETHPAFVALTAAGVVLVSGLHLVASFRETGFDGSGPAEAEWVDAGPVADIPQDRAVIVPVQGAERIAIFRRGDTLSAISNVCAHQGGPLGEGKIVDDCLTCPWHGYQYKVECGQSPPPFTEKVPTYRVRIEDGRALVDPSPLPPGTPVEPAQIPTA